MSDDFLASYEQLLNAMIAALQSLPPPTPGARPPTDRLLPKPLFSGKPHNDYSRHARELDFIFTDVFPCWTPDSYRRTIRPIAQIPKATIFRWKDHWATNPLWRPWDTKSNHGTHNRQFTDEQEAEISKKIITEYVEVGRLFSCGTFSALIAQYWADLGRDPADFKCSTHFIHDSRSSGVNRRTAA
jgi:hypothetical protein